MGVFLQMFCCGLALVVCFASHAECLLGVDLEKRISTEGITLSEEVNTTGLAPRGSAVLTSSGELAPTGITAIIHAASGSASRNDPAFVPSLEGVVMSVRNSILLAQKNDFNSIAIPFIGGKIFLSRIGISAEELAAAIVDSILSTPRDNIEVKLVAFGQTDFELFQKILHERGDPFPVLEGSITDFSLHHCPVIVNAANMEVEIGGGISGVIGAASGSPARLNAEAKTTLKDFYLANSITVQMEPRWRTWLRSVYPQKRKK